MEQSFEEVGARFSFPDRLHPKVQSPLIVPENWERLAELVSIRLSLGVTQGEVALLMNSSASKISRLERGRCSITPENCTAYEEALKKLHNALVAQYAPRAAAEA